MSLVFICRENPRRLEIFLFPNCPRFCRLMKTRNRRYPRLSWKDGDKSGKSGTLLFSRRVPDFSDGLRWISPITNPLNCWAPVPLSYVCVQISIFEALSISCQIQYRENLGQTSYDYPIHRHWIGDGRQKVKSPIVWDFPGIWKPGFSSKMTELRS